MKRLVTGYVLVLGLTISLSQSSVHAISLSFVPSSQTVTAGSSADVAVRISGLGNLTAPSLGAYDITIGFNTAVLSFNSVVYGDPVLGDQLDLFGLGSLTSTPPSAGSVELFELSLDSPSDLDSFQAPDFILARLTFNTLGVGTSSLTFSGVVLADAANGDPLTAQLGTGSVTVEGDRGTAIPAPEPSSMLLIGLGLVLLAWRLRRSIVR
jgi:PEP-CTERM motif-containing protein